jgi:hypothetical protein
MDFAQVWRNTMKVKILTGLDPEVNAHVQIYHRVQFYRENILYDYIKSSYLEHILVMVSHLRFRLTLSAARASSRV